MVASMSEPGTGDRGVGTDRIPAPGPRIPAARRATRVAIVHDWLTGMRGGEKVLEAICELYPGAPIFTLLHVPGQVSPPIERHRIRTSFVQAIPGASGLYRQLLPLFPLAVELFDLDDYDLVISSSHCAAKSVIRSGRAVHVCYCHSPMRYAWDQFDAYFGPDQVGRLRSRMLRPVMAALARWDAATAGRVDRFLANSQYVAGRIQRYYNRRSIVVHPPVDTAFYSPNEADHRDTDLSFLVVSALVPYKRLDVAIEACRLLGARLTVVGRGPELSRLQQLGGDVAFVGWRTDEEIRQLYRRSTAVLLPGVEDFGIVPVEAQACGIPVVALASGGAAETIIDGVTGVLVADPSVRAFAEGMQTVAGWRLDPAPIRANAERFSRDRFMTEFENAVEDAVTGTLTP